MTQLFVTRLLSVIQIFLLTISWTSYLFYVDALQPSQQFFSHVGTSSCLPGKQWIKCLAQGHNTVPPMSL